MSPLPITTITIAVATTRKVVNFQLFAGLRSGGTAIARLAFERASEPRWKMGEYEPTGNSIRNAGGEDNSA